MYNEDIKKRYEELKNNTALLDKFAFKTLFSRTEPFEKKLGKDLCNFTTEEIKDMYKLLNFYTFSTITIFHSNCRQYTSWCMNQGLVKDSQNHFEEISVSQLIDLLNPSIVKMTQITREDLLTQLPNLQNPSSQFVLLGLFEGIKGKQYSDFYYLKEGDIDLEHNLINIHGRDWLPFSQQLCNIGIESAQEENYYPYDAKEKEYVKFIPSDKVIKDYPTTQTETQKTAGRRVYMGLLRSLKHLYGEQNYIRGNLVVDSGIAWFITERSKHYGITPMEYISKYTDEINKQYDRRYTPYKYRILYESFL